MPTSPPSIDRHAYLLAWRRCPLQLSPFLAGILLYLTLFLTTVPAQAQSRLLFDQSRGDTSLAVPGSIGGVSGGPRDASKGKGYIFERISVPQNRLNDPNDDVFVITDIFIDCGRVVSGFFSNTNFIYLNSTFYLANGIAQSNTIAPELTTMQVIYNELGPGLTPAGNYLFSEATGNPLHLQGSYVVKPTASGGNRLNFFVGLNSAELPPLNYAQAEIAWMLSNSRFGNDGDGFLSIYQYNTTAQAADGYGSPAQFAVKVYGYSRSHYYTTRPVPAITSVIGYGTGRRLNYLIAGTKSDVPIFLAGTGFDTSSRITIDGVSVPTEFFDITALATTIPASLLQSVHDLRIVVTNPAPGGGTSQAYLLPVLAGNSDGSRPVPKLTTVAPSPLYVNSGPQTMTLTGSGFYPDSVVRVNGSVIPTLYVSGTTLSAQVSNSFLGGVQTLNFTVSTPANSPLTGGGLSNAVTVNVVLYPTPTISSLDPAGAIKAAGAATVTVNGTNFFPTSQVRVNGASVATTYVSATQLTAVFPSSVIPNPGGSAAVTVVNIPAPPTVGGGTSNIVNFLGLSTVFLPQPGIINLSPGGAMKNGSPVTVAVNGYNFALTSQVQVNGVSLPTTYVSSSRLTAVFPDSIIPDAGGVIPVTVVTTPNPPATVGGGTSDAVNFKGYGVSAVPMTITPNNIVIGSDPSRYTIRGTGFASGKTQVFINYVDPTNGAGSGGGGRDIQVISDTELQVTVDTSSYTFQPGYAFYVTVANPGQAPNPNPPPGLGSGGYPIELTPLESEVTISGLIVSGTTSTGTTISWQTNVTTYPDTIEYGLTPDYGQTGNVYSVGNKSYAASLSGLTPGTLYYYKASASGGGTKIATATGTFVTAKAAGSPTIMVSGATVSRSGSTVTVTLTLKNSGDGAATDLVLNTATLGGASATVSLPQSQGPVAAGATITVSLTFTGVPSGAATLKVQGTYTGGAGGSFDLNRRVSVP